MLAQVSRWISSGWTSSAPVAVAAWSRSSLSVFESFFSPFFVAAGQRRRLHDGEHLADPILAECGDGGGDRPVVADELRGSDEHCRDVAVQPELLVGRVGRGEVVEHDLTVGNEDAHGSSSLWLIPARWRWSTWFHSDASTSSVICSVASWPRGVPGCGVVISTAASGPPIPVLTTFGACTPARSATNIVYPMCSTCWIRLPNTGSPGSLYISRCHHLGGDLGVALVAAEHVDAVAARRTRAPRPSRCARRIDSVAGRMVGGVVAEVGERRPHLVDGRLSGRRTEGHEHRRRRWSCRAARRPAGRTATRRRDTSWRTRRGARAARRAGAATAPRTGTSANAIAAITATWTAG